MAARTTCICAASSSSQSFDRIGPASNGEGAGFRAPFFMLTSEFPGYDRDSGRIETDVHGNTTTETMVFSTPSRLPTAADAERHTYDLWQRFKFPTEHGNRDAVAVPEKAGHQLVGAYTFLLNITFFHIWVALVLLAVYLSVRKDNHSDHVAEVSGVVWINHGSPSEVLIKTSAHTWKMKQRKKRLRIAIIWIFASLTGVIINYAIPIVLVPNLVIGFGAPVRPGAIYIPSNANKTNRYQLEIANLDIPSALRAAGSIPVVNDTDPSVITVDKPVVLGTWDNGIDIPTDILQFNYHYNITSLGFGLQHYHDLALYVTGSCFTENNWLSDQQEVNGTVIDIYRLWNESRHEYSVSLFDGASPHVYFFSGNATVVPNGLNTTYAAVISSTSRKSYTPGRDPWYLTDPDPILDTASDSGEVYRVATARPVLSCWQLDSWSSGGKNASGYDISSLPGLSTFPKEMETVFKRYLIPPKIVLTATYLGAGALASGTSALGEYFSANTSTIYADFSRLLLASYISSVNTLTDTTLYAQKFPDIAQLIPKEKIDKVGGFVLYSSHISTLAVLDLIIIPVVALGLWVLVLVLVTWEKPREKIRKLEERHRRNSEQEEKSGGGRDLENGTGAKHDSTASKDASSSIASPPISPREEKGPIEIDDTNKPKAELGDQIIEAITGSS
ncbi:hypothetical protein FGG08_004961 [Glutinoglossum americanum]|uniref:Uncharacterized protein n=1 Tax=Glutinoglossum americanum TaxID=1670608 RepID=A0A9P8I6F9_9PEZI|nr:hypothetical protein FGG08_004961 [Glutinoglossum americanum]